MTNQAKLFCSEPCAEEAKSVRYARRCIRDGRIELPDVRDAIEIRLGMVLSGGYPERERLVSRVIRQAVIARDGGRCQECGQDGTDIDHIEDSNNELENLRLLCRICHNKKTKAGFVEIPPGSEHYDEATERQERLLSRINVSVSKRSCDDDKHWCTSYPRLLLERQKFLKKKDARANRGAR